MPRLSVVFLIIFLSFTLSLSYGQDLQTHKDSVDYKLGEVVISATRTLRQLSSLPLQVQLIKEKEIRSTNASRLSEVLAEQNGLVTIPGHTGGEGIQMQGLDVAYTLILIDEMPLVGRVLGQLDLNRISVGNIQQVEIVKGASSSLYGSEALGGVINVITKIPEDGLKASVNYKESRFATHDASMNIGYRKKQLQITSFFNMYGSDGYHLSTSEVPTVTPFYNTTARTKIAYRFNDKTDLSLSGRYFLQNQVYMLSKKEKGQSHLSEWNLHVKLNHRYNRKWSSYFEMYATDYKTHEYIQGGKVISGDADSNFQQFYLRPEIRGKYSPREKTDIIFGIGGNFEDIKKTIFISDSEMQSYHLYGQLDTYLTSKMNLIAGFRYDLHSQYTSQFSPKLALKYDFSDKISVKTSVGYGYKAPDFRQLYNNFTNSSVGYSVLGYNAVPQVLSQMEKNGEIASVYVDKSEFTQSKLAPESSISFNFGVDIQPLSELKLQLNLFRNDIKNLIDSQIIAVKYSGQSVYSYRNIERVYTQGMEANVSYFPIKNLTLSAGYQLLYAKNKTAENRFQERKVYARDANGDIFQLQSSDYFGLFNRSRHSANFKIFYQLPIWNTDLNFRGVYRGKYGIADTNANTYLDKYDDFVPAHLLLNVTLNKHFGERFTLGVGVNNLTDYTNVKYISNIPGRIMYASLNINF